MKSKRITIIVTRRSGESADITLDSLKAQTYQDFKIVTVEDVNKKGACWARNEGFKQCDTELVLFSDNDINWKNHALEKMVKVLDMTKASYCYGRYLLGKDIWSHQPWDARLLQKQNYISTMSLIRAKDFPSFDENLKRLQDWDLWLTMLEQGKRGVYCNDLIFTTEVKPGITYNEKLDPFAGYIEFLNIVQKKHNLPLTI